MGMNKYKSKVLRVKPQERVKKLLKRIESDLKEKKETENRKQGNNVKSRNFF